MIYHITTKLEWEHALTLGKYEAESLQKEGFIHMSHLHQIEGVLERYFQGKTDLIKLNVDETKLIAEIVWRLEAVKSWFTKKTPLLTKETANTARANVSFDNTKLLEQLPGFSYQPLSNSIERICKELKEMHQLV